MIERMVFTVHADVDTDTDQIVRAVVMIDGERYVVPAERLAALAEV